MRCGRQDVLATTGLLQRPVRGLGFRVQGWIGLGFRVKVWVRVRFGLVFLIKVKVMIDEAEKRMPR